MCVHARLADTLVRDTARRNGTIGPSKAPYGSPRGVGDMVSPPCPGCERKQMIMSSTFLSSPL